MQHFQSLILAKNHKNSFNFIYSNTIFVIKIINSIKASKSTRSSLRGNKIFNAAVAAPANQKLMIAYRSRSSRSRIFRCVAHGDIWLPRKSLTMISRHDFAPNISDHGLRPKILFAAPHHADIWLPRMLQRAC